MNTPGHNPHQFINILAFDTSGDEASLALWANGKMRLSSLPPSTGPHSQAACLVPAMQDLLKEGELDFRRLDVIATSIGPGSFTGIRVGLATAQGLLLSTQSKSFAPTTFQLLAFGAWKERVRLIADPDPSLASPCLVTIPTKRDSFYTHAFEKACIPSGTANVQTEDEVQHFLALNPGMQRVNLLSASNAEILIHFYFYNQQANQPLPLEAQRMLHPYYVHNPDFATQKPCPV